MQRGIVTLLLSLAFALPTAASADSGVEWKRWAGRLPQNAIVGGIDHEQREQLYICRAYYTNGVHPGKILGKKCNIGWGTREIVLDQFEVLVSTNPRYRTERYSESRRR